MSEIEYKDTQDLLNVSEIESESSDNYPEDTTIICYESQKESKNPIYCCVFLIISCIIVFLSSSVLIVTFPVYLEYSKKPKLITSYSKIVTVITLSTGLTLLLWVAKVFFCKIHNVSYSHKLSVSLPCVLKGCLLQSFANLLIIWLNNDKITCHLQDPFYGCVMLFSLLFYYMYAKRKSSMERIFCSITVIVGVCITVDYGLCNRFRCRGVDLIDQQQNQLNPSVRPPWNLLYIGLYIIAMAVYALHFTLLENAWQSSPKQESATCDLSVIQDGSSTLIEDRTVTNNNNNNESSTNTSSHHIIARSLSIISNGRFAPQASGKKDLYLNMPAKTGSSEEKFPLTSTPNIDSNHDSSINLLFNFDCCDIVMINYFIMWLVAAAVCWMPTLAIFNPDKPKLLVQVLDEVALSIACHISRPNAYTSESCSELVFPTVILIASAVTLSIFSIIVLRLSRSALMLTACYMNALPIAGIFWAMYELNPSSNELLKFKWEITGEAVSAFLGFPIIGIGTFLLLKSHIRYLILEHRFE